MVFFSQESWRGGGTVWRARSSRPLQFAPPGPIHQMSDELVYNETKSLLVRHDSQGGVPIMYLFTYFFRCMLKHLLICLKHFLKKYFHVTECEHFSFAPWLVGLDSHGPQQIKSHFLRAGPNFCVTPTHCSKGLMAHMGIYFKGRSLKQCPGRWSKHLNKTSISPRRYRHWLLLCSLMVCAIFLDLRTST